MAAGLRVWYDFEVLGSVMKYAHVGKQTAVFQRDLQDGTLAVSVAQEALIRLNE